MDENLLKYFTGNGEPTTETIMPTNISNKIISVEEFEAFFGSLISRDGNYFIRYGGESTGNYYNAIEVYDIDSLDNSQASFVFDNIKIDNKKVLIRDLKQDEEGRFYAIGAYTTQTYLILFNNFIQDKEIIIRKYYTSSTIGLTSEMRSVIKKEGGADYYILTTEYDKIFHYKIDITSGNTLDTITYTQGGTYNHSNLSDIGNMSRKLYKTNNKIILLENWYDFSNNISQVTRESKKLIIDTETTQETYQTIPFYKKTFNNTSGTTNTAISAYSYLDYIGCYSCYMNEDLKTLYIDLITIDGNITTLTYSNNVDVGNNRRFNGARVVGNYVMIAEYSQEVEDYPIAFTYYSPNTTALIKYSQISASYQLSDNPQIIKKYNLIAIVGLSYFDSVFYSKNTYSQGYSSTPYYNNNFLIPQYINLYGNANDNTSVIFSRDASNRFLAGNQLTATFNVPNYMLNNASIQREDVLGQTNQTIESDIIQYSKNRFESLYLSYIYNMYITDNTNSNNELNTAGANRLANSVWNALDYQDSPLAKARVTYEDGLQDILNLNITNISGNTCTFEYEVSGNINKIEYLSNDEETVYATYRCNLTGTNTISQTITIEEG